MISVQAPPIPLTAGGLFQRNPWMIGTFVEFWHAFDIRQNNGAISSWVGRNGNALTVAGMISAGFASAIAPAYSAGGLNGVPGVYFSGAASLATPNNLASGTYANGFCSVLVIFPKACTTSAYAIDIQAFGTYYSGNNYVGMDWAPNTAGASPIPSFITGKTVQNNSGSGLAAKHRASCFRPQVIVYNVLGAVAELWIDGVCVHSTSNSFTTPTLAGPCILGNGYSDAAPFSYGIGASALGNRALLDSEIRQISADLGTQFTQNTAPAYMVVGDSFGECLLSTANTTLYDQMQPLFPGNRMINACVSGNTNALMAANGTPYANMFNAIRVGTICCVWPGQNDILNGDSAATIYANMQTIFARIHLQGGIVQTVTPIPKDYAASGGNQVAMEAVRQSLITLINANGGVQGTTKADSVINLNIVAPFNDPTAYNQGTYYTDGHPTTAAYALMLQPFQGATQAAWGMVAYDTGWIANSDSGDKTAVVGSTATLGTIATALDIVTAGAGTQLKNTAQKVKAIEAVLVASKLPNV